LNDYPRRRRLDPEPPKRGGLPIVPLMVLIVLGGLLLGGLLTKFFGPGPVQTPTPLPSFTPLPEATATYAPQNTPTPNATPTERLAKATPKAVAASSRAPSPVASATAAPSLSAPPSSVPASSPTPRPKIVAAKKTPPVIFVTPAPQTSAAQIAQAASPAAAMVAGAASPVLITGANSGDHAASIVRAYIAALARGDSATATGYLASGLPSESFINPDVSVNVSDLRTNSSGDGYNVTTQIVTSKGTYIAQFTLKMGPYGMQITDHSAQHI
jgi:hypothetical protein